MASSLSNVDLNSTPQTEKAAKGQKKNHGGGYSFKIDPMERAKRFLILGSEGTAYQSGQKLSKESAKIIVKLAETDSKALVDLIVDVSLGGRAPKQDPALFALAIASSFGSDDDKRYAREKLNTVARTGTHLFLYAGFVKQFRGWGRGLRSAVAYWYLDKNIDQLAYQVVKYQNREGYTHGDLMRLSHPSRPDDAAFNGLARWVLRQDEAEVPEIVRGYIAAHKAAGDSMVAALVTRYGLSWEMLPSESLNSSKVWEALLDGNLPLGALIRQLPRLTRLGVLKPLGENTHTVVKRLTDLHELARSRQHPLNLLIAQRTYASGHSLRGDSSWTPVPEISEALNKAFYLSFDFVEPTGKRYFQSTDISGSMSCAQLGGYGITAMEAALAMLMVTLRTEERTFVSAFQYGLEPLPNLTKDMRLDQIQNALPVWRGGSTNIAAPMIYALQHKIEADVFIVYTDNETNSGPKHAHEALEAYRKGMGIDAKLIVVAMTSTGFSVADPNDPGQLDVVGFDTSVPQLIAEFSKGL